MDELIWRTLIARRSDLKNFDCRTIWSEELWLQDDLIWRTLLAGRSNLNNFDCWTIWSEELWLPDDLIWRNLLAGRSDLKNFVCRTSWSEELCWTSWSEEHCSPVETASLDDLIWKTLLACRTLLVGRSDLKAFDCWTIAEWSDLKNSFQCGGDPDWTKVLPYPFKPVIGFDNPQTKGVN